MRNDIHNPGKVWTDEEKANAARLWNDGASAAQIAAHFCVMRNSIIGLVNRNRDIFTRRSRKTTATISTIRKPVKAVPVPAPKPDKAARPVKPAPVPRRREPEEKPVYVKPSALAASLGLPVRSGSKPKRSYDHAGTTENPVAFIDLGPRQCRWPVEGFEDRSGTGMPCCGKDIVPGRSYCRHHLNLAYKVISRD